MTTVSPEAARRWMDRWDNQQEGYVPDREDRFTTIIDAVELAAGRPDPLVVDLGCGPGSLAARLLDRLPGATVVAVDTDPLLLGLGAAAYDGVAGLRFTELDLRAPGWAARLGLDRPADAAVSTTALHWLAPEELSAVYAELATVLRPGGVVLNGDHLSTDDTSPVRGALERAVYERRTARRFGAGRPEDWATWWTAFAADPEVSGLVSARSVDSDASGHHGSPSGLLSTHEAALRAAGFAEVGPIWQHGNDRVLAGVRPE
ncbi:MAG TPA: class I SAM-dependent methyltransferase [Streptosporangiaceae bacterium]|jgi:SAM-dependent methyltransferase